MVKQGERRSNESECKNIQKVQVLRHEGVECQGSVEIEKYEFHRWLLFWSFESPLQAVSFAVNIESPRPICKLHEGFVVLLKTILAYAWYHSMRLTRWKNLETRLCDKICFNCFFSCLCCKNFAPHCELLCHPCPSQSPCLGRMEHHNLDWRHSCQSSEVGHAVKVFLPSSVQLCSNEKLFLQ